MKREVKIAVCLGLLLSLTLLLSGCGEKKASEEKALSCQEWADTIQASADFAELTDVNEKYLEKYLLIDASDLSEWAMRRDATRATPEMILVLSVKEEADLNVVKKYVQEYHDEQILQYRDYQPGQLFKLENAKVLQHGRMICLIVSPDAAKTTQALGSGWQ